MRSYMHLVAAAFLLAVGFPVQSYSLPRGLLAYYPCSKNANDASGNGNHATAAGALLTADRFNRDSSAYYLDGNSSVKVLSNAFFPGNGPFTVSLWVKPSDKQERQDFFWTGQASNLHSIGILYDDMSANSSQPVNEGIAFAYYGCPGFAGTYNTVTRNAWNHIVVTYSVGDTVSMYINGRFDKKYKPACVPDVAVGPLYFGRDDPSDGQATLKGSIDDMMLFNRAICAAEVDSLYRGLYPDQSLAPVSPPQRGAPIAAWSFDSVSGNTYYDITRNGHDATATGNSFSLGSGIKGQAFSGGASGFDCAVANCSNGFNVNTLTIESWFNASAISTGGQQKILDYCSIAPGVRNGYSLWVDQGHVSFGFSNADGSNWIVLSGNSTLVAGRWYHLAGTYDNSTLCVYVNGVLDGSIAYSGNIKAPPAGTAARIGLEMLSTGTQWYYVNGKIDELRIYGYALSPSAILASFQAVEQKRRGHCAWILPGYPDFKGNGRPDTLPDKKSTGTIQNSRQGGLPQEFAIRAISSGLSLKIACAVPARSVGGNGVVSLDLLDLKGEQVRAIHAGPLGAGEHLFSLESTGIASGIHLCRMRAGAVSRIIPVILKK